MNYPKLFEPTSIGSLNLRNRIVLSPIATNFSVGDNAKFTERYIEYYKERARGGVGLIITTHVKAEKDIDPYPITYGYATIDSSREIKYFTELTESVHQFGAKIAIELSPGSGRIVDELIPGKRPIGPSEIPLLTMPEIMTRELTKDEVFQLVKSYGRAAGLAKQSGFDAIYVHFLAYLGDQFLSSCWNHRTDEYGGSLENRMRFLLECIDSVRSQVGNDFPMIVGLALDHGFSGGRELEETKQIIKKLEPLGIDALHLRRGSYDAMNLLIPTTYMKEGVSVDYAYEIKKSTDIPVIVDGKLTDLDYCEKLLVEGKTDFIGMARSFLTDPFWPQKAKAGKNEDILPCIHCMQCVNRLLFAKYSACTVNPRYGREYEGQLPRVSKPKKVLVVGGGPGGMSVSKYLSERGHKVTLLEKRDKLGGHLLEAAVPAYKKGTDDYFKWLKRQLKKSDVTIKLGTTATPESVLYFKPDAVVICTGSTPTLPKVPGIDRKNVVIATDLLANYQDVGKNIVIVGAGLVGCEMALFLKEKGVKNVTLIDMLPEIGHDVLYMAKHSLLEELKQKTIVTRPSLNLKEVTQDGIVAEDPRGNIENINADTVIIATGLEAKDNLYDELENEIGEIYKIGDCVSPRKFIDAIQEAYSIAKVI